MAKILLINPPAPFLAFPDSGPHLGVGYLLSYLKRYGIDAVYLNLESIKPEEVEIPEGYEFYGLTAVTPQYHYANQVRKQIQARNLGKVIIGGVHASVMPQACLKDGFDYVVTGYGESALLNILQGASEGILIGQPLPNINENALPDWDQLWRQYDVSYGQRTGQILTMRGCPFTCYYCCSERVYGRETYFRNVASIVTEVEYLIKTYGISNLYFYDTNFTFDRTRAIQIAAALKPYNLRWAFQTRVDLIDPELLLKLREGGCEQLSLGIESGSTTIERLGKDTTIRRNAQAIQMCHDAGLRVKAFLIGALPDETHDTSEMFKEFLVKNTPDDWLYSTFTPFPGTAYWDEPKRFGLDIHNRDSRLYYPLGLNARGPINVSSLSMNRDQLYQSREDMLDFLRRLIPSQRVERAISLFPQQRPAFERALGDYVF